MDYGQSFNDSQTSDGPPTSNSAYLLMIEDDPTAAFVLAAALKYGGFGCDVATTAFDALRLVGQDRYDAVLLDLGLPDMDGLQLIKTLRFHMAVPLIVISGQDTEEERVAALDAGADDFVAKPYFPSELLARIRAALRRHLRGYEAERGRPELEIAEAPAKLKSVQPASETISWLGPKEQKLLDVLLAASGEVVTSQDLVSTLGLSGTVDVRQAIHALRRKIADHHEPITIRNVRGLGYCAVKHKIS